MIQFVRETAWGIFIGILVVPLFSPQPLLARKVRANIKRSDYDSGVVGFQKFSVSGRRAPRYRLGSNKVNFKCADPACKNKSAQIRNFYRNGDAEVKVFDTASGIGSIVTPDGITSGLANSSMDVKSQNPDGSYKYGLDLTAFAERTTLNAPRARAVARGNDPLFFLPSPTGYSEPITAPLALEAGSSIFTEDAFDHAYYFWDITTSLLPDPIFSIEFFKSGTSGLEVTVFQNSDSRVSFSMTASDIETILESNSELVTEAGLSSSLPLGNFSFDLQDTDISSNDFFSPDGNTCSFVDSGSESITIEEARLECKDVPEPSAPLSFLALGTLGAASTLTRKLKPSIAAVKDTAS